MLQELTNERHKSSFVLVCDLQTNIARRSRAILFLSYKMRTEEALVLLIWSILAAYAHHMCTYAARTREQTSLFSSFRSVRAHVMRVRCEKWGTNNEREQLAALFCCCSLLLAGYAHQMCTYAARNERTSKLVL